MWRKAGVDEARGRVGQQAEAAERRLASSRREIVGQRAQFQRRAEDELAGMQHERLARIRLHEAGELVLLDRRVDVGIASVVEDTEHVVEADVDARGCTRFGSYGSMPSRLRRFRP